MSGLFIGEDDDENGEDDDVDPLALSSAEEGDGSGEEDWGSSSEEEHRGGPSAFNESGRALPPPSLEEAQQLLGAVEVMTTLLVRYIIPRLTQQENRHKPRNNSSTSITGLARLKCRLHAERRHIAECIRTDRLEHLRGNNVAALGVIVGLLGAEPNVRAVMHRFTVRGEQQSRLVEVDLISDGGRRWIKVKASSPSNMLREVVGGSGGRLPAHLAPPPPPVEGQAPFLDTVRLIVGSTESSARRWLPFGLTPYVVIACATEPPAAVRDTLRLLSPQLSVEVYPRFACGPDSVYVSRAADIMMHTGHTNDDGFLDALVAPRRAPTRVDVAYVNFDVNAIVALICDCCHGYAGYLFPRNPVCNQQSIAEANGERVLIDYIWPALRRLTVWGDSTDAADVEDELRDAQGERVSSPNPPGCSGRPLNWIIAKRAFDELQVILRTVAGEHEAVRAAWMLRRLRVIDESDPVYVSPVVSMLRDGKKVRERHRAVFGVGDACRAVTITANHTFVQAALEQGVTLLVEFHPSRSLTERKRRASSAAFSQTHADDTRTHIDTD